MKSCGCLRRDLARKRGFKTGEIHNPFGSAAKYIKNKEDEAEWRLQQRVKARKKLLNEEIRDMFGLKKRGTI